MARDNALLVRAARTGETVFSIYSWARPTLSFGRNQLARGLYDLGRIRDLELDVVRRPTGGRAILHHREVTYSVTAPIDPAVSLREAYRQINGILQLGLAKLGVIVESAVPAGRAPGPSIRPCFESPTDGELLADGAKLVGSAQWRDESSLLQHGSILVDDDQSSLPGLVTEDSRAAIGPLTPPATLSTLMGRPPSSEEVATAMFEAVRDLEDPRARELDENELRDDTRTHLPHYLDEAWTWRR